MITVNPTGANGMNIPDEAIEAAAKRLAVIGGQPHNWAHYRAPASEALAAAAPCLMAQAWERGRVDGYHHRPNPYKETK